MAIFDWKPGIRRSKRVKRAVKPDPEAELRQLREAIDSGDIIGSPPETMTMPQAPTGSGIRPIGRLANVVGQFQQQDEARINEQTKLTLSKIAVVAFVGPSGTGKSTRAIRVCQQNDIHYLIDDGLLIHGSRIVAGSSAKRAPLRWNQCGRRCLWIRPARPTCVGLLSKTSRPR